MQHDIALSLSKNSNLVADLTSLEKSRKALDATLKNAEKIVSALSEKSISVEIGLKADIQSDIDEGFSASFEDVAPKKQIKSKICFFRLKLCLLD